MKNFNRAIFFFVPLLVSGCAQTFCINQHCYTEFSDLAFVLRWVLTAIVLLCLILVGFRLILAISRFDITEKEFLVLLFLSILVGLPIAYSACPGFSKLSGVPFECQYKLAKGQRDPHARKQLLSSCYARIKLEEQLKEQLKPLESQYKRELESYKSSLSSLIQNSKIQSHKQLLEEKQNNLDLALTLNKAAILSHSLVWLDTKIKKAEDTTKILTHNEFRLQKIIELNNVTSQEDSEEIQKIVAAAETIIDTKTPVPAKQDIADFENKLFQEAFSAKR